MRSATSMLAATALLGALAGPATATELLTNGTFDSGLEPFVGCCGAAGTVTFDPTRDASGSSLSGSARLAHIQPSVNSLLFVFTCISGLGPLEGKKFFFGAKVRFDGDEATPGRAFLSVEFRPGEACQGASISSVFDDVEVNLGRRGAWIPLTIGSRKAGVVAPAGANSMRLHVVVEKKAPSTLTVNVDDVFAAPEGTPVSDGMPATIVGTAASDLLIGTAGSDVIVGRGGNDEILGKGGNDRLCGGAGADVLDGGAGDDRLFGEGGSDKLQGAGGNDLLVGGSGKDTLVGGPGADKLKGGGGKDTCNGKAGADTAAGCETVLGVP